MSEFEWLDPFELELKSRFDIAAKFNYAKAFAAGVLTDFHRRAYVDHIRVFNAFNEEREGGSPKLSAEDFLGDFDALLAAIKQDGFDPSYPVTIDDRNQPHDGAHRVAAALALSEKIAMQRTTSPFSARWNFEFFASRGMRPDYLDFAAAAQLELNRELRSVVLFGSALGKSDEIETILADAGEILYRKRLELTRRGTDNLIRVLYEGERWLGRRELGFLGAGSKARPCFPESAPRAAIVLWLRPSIDNDQMIELKAKARALVGLGKHSMHITDTHLEAKNLADWTLNPNARHLLNHKSYRYLVAFERDFADLASRIEKTPAARSKVCVVGSSALSVYGLRDARDLDIVDIDDAAATLDLPSSNSHWGKWGFDPAALVNSPENHLVFRGIKCLSLDRLAELKKRRGEAKDQIDLALIDEILPRPGGVGKLVSRAALLFRLYSNRGFLRSYAGHWRTRIKRRLGRG